LVTSEAVMLREQRAPMAEVVAENGETNAKPAA
jgi:hypothetical protein